MEIDLDVALAKLPTSLRQFFGSPDPESLRSFCTASWLQHTISRDTAVLLNSIVNVEECRNRLENQNNIVAFGVRPVFGFCSEGLAFQTTAAIFDEPF